MPTTAPEPWMSIMDIARHLGVHSESVRRWVKGSGMPAVKIGKNWRFKASEVDAWAKAGAGRQRARRRA